jgi:hypothetical protein
MNNDQLYFYNRGYNDCLAKFIDSNPAKTLTDEEIKAVYGEYFDIENCDWLHLQCIQAILRKAQKK